MSKKSKALIINFSYLGFAQWLIFSHQDFLAKLVISLAFFLAVFFFAEKNYLRFKVIFRNFLPLMIILGMVSFIIFERNILPLETMVIFASLCLYLFYSRLEIPLEKKIARQVAYFWLDLCILLTIYLLSLAIYQLVSFADLPLWSLVLGLGILGGAVFGFGLWARNVNRRVLAVFLSLFVLITLEVFIVLSFWREAFPLYKALILALLYYIFIGLLDIRLKGQRLKDNFLGYLIFAIVIFVLIIFSVDWRTFQ